MKKYLLIFAVAFLISACGQNSGTDPASGADSSYINEENIITTNVTPTSSLEFIKKWDGKTALEAGLFEDTVLVARLNDLLKNEFQYFRENWNVQTPIHQENDIYTASGCKQNDCPSYYSIVYFDIENNNINVLIKRGLLFKLFTEKGEIPLPAEMKKDQNIIRAHA